MAKGIRLKPKNRRKIVENLKKRFPKDKSWMWNEQPNYRLLEWYKECVLSRPLKEKIA